MKLKKGDQVIVITGKDKGQTGEILEVLPAENKVVVDGVNVRTIHKKPTQAKPEGGIVKLAKPIDASNLAISEGGKAVKVGFKIDAKSGKKTRVNKKTGKEIK